MNPQAEQKTASELITGDELAQRYKVSRRCVTNWINARVIPCIRVGRVLRFDPARVKTALEKFEQQEITR